MKKIVAVRAYFELNRRAPTEFEYAQMLRKIYELAYSCAKYEEWQQSEKKFTSLDPELRELFHHVVEVLRVPLARVDHLHLSVRALAPRRHAAVRVLLRLLPGRRRRVRVGRAGTHGGVLRRHPGRGAGRLGHAAAWSGNNFEFGGLF